MAIDTLLKQLIDQGYLRTPEIINAFKTIKRRDFLPKELLGEEGLNIPLPIGKGQTISQPLTVAFMLEQLQAQIGHTVLDIGSGSGWTTALLAQIVGSGGMVYAVERVAELCTFGQKNVEKYHKTNVKFFCQDGSDGLPEYAPFDRILVSAAAKKIPSALKAQLAINGRLVIPTTEQDVRLIQRQATKLFTETVYSGFIFVPLIEG